MNATTADECVIAVFHSPADAQRAVDDLAAHKFRPEQLSLITPGHEGDLERANPSRHGDRAEKSAASGAAVGGALGLLAGSSLLVIPGLGPIVAAGAIASGITGGIVGGLVGAMGGWGVKGDQGTRYAKELAAGKALVLVTGEPAALADAKALLLASPAERVAIHSETADSDKVDA
jgi:hypothetical protein